MRFGGSSSGRRGVLTRNATTHDCPTRRSGAGSGPSLIEPPFQRRRRARGSWTGRSRTRSPSSRRLLTCLRRTPASSRSPAGVPSPRSTSPTASLSLSRNNEKPSRRALARRRRTSQRPILHDKRKSLGVGAVQVGPKIGDNVADGFQPNGHAHPWESFPPRGHRVVDAVVVIQLTLDTTGRAVGLSKGS